MMMLGPPPVERTALLCVLLAVLALVGRLRTVACLLVLAGVAVLCLVAPPPPPLCCQCARRRRPQRWHPAEEGFAEADTGEKENNTMTDTTAQAEEEAPPAPGPLDDDDYVRGVVVADHTDRPAYARFVPSSAAARRPAGEATPAAQSASARDVLMRVAPAGSRAQRPFRRTTGTTSSYAWLR